MAARLATACGTAFSVVATGVGPTLATAGEPAFAAALGDDAPTASGRMTAVFFGCCFGSVCLLADLTAASTRAGRRVSFRALTGDFAGVLGFAVLETFFFVVFETRLTAAPPVFLFFFGAAERSTRFAGAFFRALTFGFAPRFRGLEEADRVPARGRDVLAEDVFSCLEPLAFADFFVDFLRAAIILSKHD